ncbi:hypothetical protein GCM10014719_40100 [Planomonospora parontospora subsp. antibiotica]|nr:hypothetical protein GCM10014719_40100 [Planomonospora parontospora subsp. antibiotica]GII17226.1 hypothetical protein Ppa05_39520 [Planomonospora parontospora subsp. antibiotica]
MTGPAATGGVTGPVTPCGVTGRAAADGTAAAGRAAGRRDRPRPYGVTMVGTVKKTSIAIATQMRKPTTSQTQSW